MLRAPERTFEEMEQNKAEHGENLLGRVEGARAGPRAVGSRRVPRIFCCAFCPAAPGKVRGDRLVGRDRREDGGGGRREGSVRPVLDCHPLRRAVSSL